MSKIYKFQWKTDDFSSQKYINLYLKQSRTRKKKRRGEKREKREGKRRQKKAKEGKRGQKKARREKEKRPPEKNMVSPAGRKFFDFFFLLKNLKVRTPAPRQGPPKMMVFSLVWGTLIYNMYEKS